jgi:hypothetical protein
MALVDKIPRGYVTSLVKLATVILGATGKDAGTGAGNVNKSLRRWHLPFCRTSY